MRGALPHTRDRLRQCSFRYRGANAIYWVPLARRRLDPLASASHKYVTINRCVERLRCSPEAPAQQILRVDKDMGTIDRCAFCIGPNLQADFFAALEACSPPDKEGRWCMVLFPFKNIWTSNWMDDTKQTQDPNKRTKNRNRPQTIPKKNKPNASKKTSRCLF